LNPEADVCIYPPNYSYRFAGTSGDIELRIGGKSISAFECKDGPYTLTDICHGIMKTE